MLRTKQEFQEWLIEGERLAEEFDAKALSVRVFWLKRRYRKLAATVRAEMDDARKEFAEWA